MKELSVTGKESIEHVAYEVRKVTITDEAVFIEDVVEDQGFLQILAKLRDW